MTTRHTPQLLARAEQLGRDAYAAGQPAAPVACAEITAMVDGWQIGEGAADVFRAFTTGFAGAADQAAAAVLDAPDDDLQDCANCGDRAIYVSYRSWCDGCEAGQ